MTFQAPRFHHVKLATASAVMVVLWIAGAAGQPGSLSTDDRKFIMDAAQGRLADIDLAKLATLQGHSAEVKQFGHRLVDEQGKAAYELMLLARQKSVAVPAELGKKHQHLRHRLARLTGADFDRVYINETLKNHRDDVAEFRKLMQKSKDLELKVWAGQTLPTLEAQLRSAEDLATRAKLRADKP